MVFIVGNAAEIDMKQSVMKTPTDTITDDSLSRLGQQLCGGSETAVRQLLVFGRYLHQLSLRLVTEQTSHTDVRRRMLRVSRLLLPLLPPRADSHAGDISFTVSLFVCLCLFADFCNG